MSQVSDPVTSARISTIPTATYRLQFNHTFTFRDATAIVPYLAELGISHVYASPIFAAAAGSLHGYDVTDYGRINPEIGSDADFDACRRIGAHGLDHRRSGCLRRRKGKAGRPPRALSDADGPGFGEPHCQFLDGL